MLGLQFDSDNLYSFAHFAHSLRNGERCPKPKLSLRPNVKPDEPTERPHDGRQQTNVPGVLMRGGSAAGDRPLQVHLQS